MSNILFEFFFWINILFEFVQPYLGFGYSTYCLWFQVSATKKTIAWIGMDVIKKFKSGAGP